MKSIARALAAASLVAAGCGPVDGPPHPPPRDLGGDGALDPDKDNDGDGFTIHQGDCNDRDATVYPGAPELCDGRDHNCNGILDDTCDDDKDGWSILPGDKPGGDCDDHDPLVNPGAFDAPGNKVDDDCDGLTDNPPPPCDASGSDAHAFAGAIDLCAPWLLAATVNGDSDPAGRGVHSRYGMFAPQMGASFFVMSTGIAADENDPGFVLPQPGTAFHNDDPNPLPGPKKNACFTGTDEQTVHDYVELSLQVKVPTNAQSFSFRFAFFSAEYPEYVGSDFNDSFFVLLDSKAYKGNISFDGSGNPITVNVAFFTACDTAPICNGMLENVCTQSPHLLDGTGYELNDSMNQRIGGGTNWLTTTSPVSPGETATLRFILFDEGDHLWDSAVLIDNFQWQLNPTMTPATVG